MAKARKTSTAKQSGSSAKAIGIPEPNRKSVAEELNKLLADEMLVYVKTRKFHWNIVGPQFHDLHLLLEKQYDQLATVIDEIAERIRQIGFFPDGSMQQFLTQTHLKEHEGAGGIKIGQLQELIDDHTAIIRQLRTLIDEFDTKYDDAGSADFVTGLIESHEKITWMLQSTLS